MRPRYWLLSTISIILIASAAIAGLNAAIDIYGLYRPTRGLCLGVYGDPRVAKYLLSMRHVPENFNAILTGASISANWDVKRIEKLRVYNGSITGGTIVEEKAVIDAALERPGISVAFLLVHPALTWSHEFRTVEMTPGLKRSALGSLSLWDAYKDMARIRLGLRPATFDCSGTETFLSMPSAMNINMRQMWNAPEFTVDPIALRAWRTLIAGLRRRRVQLIFIVPPTSESLLRTKGVPLQIFMERMRSAIGPSDLWIDFLRPEYKEYRESRNFSDGVHLFPASANRVVEQINAQVDQWIADGRLDLLEPRKLASIPVHAAAELEKRDLSDRK